MDNKELRAIIPKAGDKYTGNKLAQKVFMIMCWRNIALDIAHQHINEETLENLRVFCSCVTNLRRIIINSKISSCS